MALTLTGVITGSAQTGFTAPTYTFTADTPPGVNGKQAYVSALGGTQTGVTMHSVSDPFTFSAFKPLTLKTLSVANAVTGIATTVPFNKYKFILRKGAQPLVNNPYKTASCVLEINVPAGADSYASAELRGMVSAFIGMLSTNSAGIGDSIVTGTI